MPETKDRLTEAAMERLVAGPMEVVRTESLSAGEATFKRLLADTKLRKGPSSLEAADLLTSFGVELDVENSKPGSPESEAARRYLRDAVPAYVSALGPDHPEVALALNTSADMERQQSPDDPSPLVDSLLQQALQIRMRTLGPNNPETVATLTQLANVRSLPERLKRNPNELADADALYRRAIAGALPGPEGDERSNKAAIELRLAKLHARSGDPRIALAEAKKALVTSEDWRPAYRRCQLVEADLNNFVELMSARGMRTQAQALLPKVSESACNGSTRGESVLASFLRRLGLGPS